MNYDRDLSTAAPAEEEREDMDYETSEQEFPMACTEEEQEEDPQFFPPNLLRTRSSSEEDGLPRPQAGEYNNNSLPLSPMLHHHRPLHATSSLDSEGVESSLSPPSSELPAFPDGLPRFRPAPSWEENDDPRLAAAAEPAAPHQRQMLGCPKEDTLVAEETGGSSVGMTTADGTALAATRQLPRHSTETTTTTTPLRSALRARKSSTAKQTPASAKRHRTPLHQRRSPRLSSAHMTPKRGGVSGDHHPHPPLPTTIRTAAAPEGGGGEVTLARPLPGLLLDDGGGDITPSGFSARRKKKSIGTVTTAASSHAALETTTETEDSMEINDIAPASFRFTSFPASLPRVNCLRTTPVGTPAATTHGTTVRKRMHFSNVQHPDHAEAAASAANRSRDDATHNTSLSSLPIEEGNLFFTETDGDETHLELLPPPPPEDGSTRSPSGTPVARTRLDFSAAMSPLGGGSLRPGQNHHPLTGGRMPDAPTTPREVKMHFQMNAANCSPIRGIPEEDYEGSSGKSAGGFSGRNRSHDTTSTDASSRPGRMRPMPDMEAFEERSSSTPTREQRSGDDTVSTKSHPPSPRLLCPPTPVRTPAWAHADSSGSPSSHRSAKTGRINRQNSLIATKILAICSPQVLTERNSLEHSVLEDDGAANPNNSSSISDSNASLSATGLSFDVETVVATQQDSMDESGDWPQLGGRPARPSLGESSERTVTLSTSFDILSLLGSGQFADVYKVRSKADGRLYAVKKTRRQFRGKRDREKALAEVRYMQRLQSGVSLINAKSSYSLYLLFFFQAWQEEGHFFCQTELCCRDTCRELIDNLRKDWRVAQARYPSFRRLALSAGVLPGSAADSFGRLTPESTIWKLCHDVCAGLSHIHSHGLAHFDIKPSNIFFIPHQRFGAMCKIGDFGMAGEIGTVEDGQEGDQKYMPLESLTNDARHPSADIFSLGLTLYELASDLDFEIPSDGPRWHNLRSGTTSLAFPPSRSPDIVQLIHSTIQPDRHKRPTADNVIAIPQVLAAGQECDTFLRDYIKDIEEFDLREEQRAIAGNQEQTPVISGRPRVWASPTFGTMLPMPPVFSPDAA